MERGNDPQQQRQRTSSCEECVQTSHSSHDAHQKYNTKHDDHDNGEHILEPRLSFHKSYELIGFRSTSPCHVFRLFTELH